MKLLLGEALWSPDAGFLLPRSGAAVVVDGEGRAIAWGSADELRRAHADVPVEEGEGVLMPGLVDCHAHLEIAALAGRVPAGLGLARWVQGLMAALPTVPAEEIQAAALRAARTMRELGTVAVADVCTNLATAPILREAGLGGVSLLEVVGANDSSGAAALERARARLQAHPPGGGVEVEIVPHSAYGTAPDVLRALARGEGVRSIHAAEHEDEVRWLVLGEGAFAEFLRPKGAPIPGERPVPYLKRLGALGRRTLLVHLVLATEEELAAARAAGATAVLCPRSNLHIGGRLPDLRAVRRAGIPWTLGTDSLVSTPDHDLLGEVRTLAEAFPEVPLGELLQAATMGGAAALGIEAHPWVRIPFERFPGGKEAFA
jgi:cytosine/adenosine deaminase-related metal-dependent hydrolase